MNTRQLIKKHFYSKHEENKEIYLKIKNDIKSFWHDVPLKVKDSDGLFNMVIEIPALSKTKMEMSTTANMNPILIKQAKKVEPNINNQIRIRDYSKDPICNYGFFPQTYSSKEKLFRNIYKGDGDPLDVVEMGGPFNHQVGDIIQVRLLGAFCLIDQGEIDWKIVVANSKSTPNNKMDELIKHMMHWFKIFKTFEGKKENIILDDNKLFSLEETQPIIEDSHKDYKNLLISTKL